MLVIENLTKKFTQEKGEITAVDHLSLKIDRGEIYALIGPNGAGKTTTLKMIVGLYKKTSGKITLFGKDITREETKERALIGYIPDEPVFYPYLTGFEHLEFVRLLYHVSEKEFEKRLKELLLLYPISSLLSSYPEHFSRGNKQKLAIMAALIHTPSLLVVDEPIVGLDPQSIEVTSKLSLSFAKRGGMILISTHTLSFVEKVANRVGIIDRGKLVFEGNLLQLKKEAKGAKTVTSAFIAITS